MVVCENFFWLFFGYQILTELTVILAGNNNETMNQSEYKLGVHTNITDVELKGFGGVNVGTEKD